SRTWDAENRDGCKRRPDLVGGNLVTGVTEYGCGQTPVHMHSRRAGILQDYRHKVKLAALEPAPAERARGKRSRPRAGRDAVAYFSSSSSRWTIMSSCLSTSTSPTS